MKQHKARIKVTSRSFSRHPVLKQELLELFPNSIFNTEGPPSGLPNIVEFLNDADGVILGLEQMDHPVLKQLRNVKIIAKYGVLHNPNIINTYIINYIRICTLKGLTSPYNV